MHSAIQESFGREGPRPTRAGWEASSPHRNGEAELKTPQGRVGRGGDRGRVFAGGCSCRCQASSAGKKPKNGGWKWKLSKGWLLDAARLESHVNAIEGGAISRLCLAGPGSSAAQQPGEDTASGPGNRQATDGHF